MPSARRLNAKDLERFRKRLQLIGARLRGDVDQLTEDAMLGGDQDGSTQPQAPIHLAEIGSENYDQEFTLTLLQNDQAAIDEVSEALRRIEEGTFGRCQACDRPIAKARLEAVPYARLCIECARNEEQGSVS